MNVTKKVLTLCFGVGIALSMSGRAQASEVQDELTRAAACDCLIDTCKVTCFSGNLGIDPCRRLLSNYIIPSTTDMEGRCAVDFDPASVISVEGNLGIHEDRSFFVNRLCAVQNTIDPDCSDPQAPLGCIPEATEENPDGCILLDCTTAINPDKTLLVNRICGTTSDCVEDLDACIEICNPKFLGDICIDAGDIGVIGDCTDEFGLATNFIHPVAATAIPTACGIKCERNEDGCIRLQGNTSIMPDKTLFVNRINPIDDVCGDTCVGNPDACTTFSGFVGMERDLRVNRICALGSELCEEDTAGCVTICNPVFEGGLCVTGDNIGVVGDCTEPNGLLTNFIYPVQPGQVVTNCGTSCDKNLDGCIRLEGNTAIKPGRVLFVNEINPIGDEDCIEDVNGNPICVGDDTACTLFSGNVGVNGDRELRVNKIIAVGSDCEPNTAGCVEICNPKFTGELCSEANIGVLGDCSDPKGILTNFIFPVEPGAEVENCGPSCVPSALNCIHLEGDTAVKFGKTLFVNEINPIANVCDDECVPDDNGCTLFSGNVGVTDGKELRVNKIIAVGSDCEPNTAGCVEICNPKFNGDICSESNIGVLGDCTEPSGVLTNFIYPVQAGAEVENCGPACEINTEGCIRLEGNTAVQAGRTFFVNRINPIGVGCEEDMNGNPVCSSNTDCDAATCFSGNVGTDGCRKVLTNFIGPSAADTEFGCIDGSRDDTTATTSVCGNLGVQPDRSFYTCRICPATTQDVNCDCPVDSVLEATTEDDQGCLQICGNVAFQNDRNVIIPGTLLVNDFGPFDEACLTLGGKDFADDSMMNFRSNATFNRDVEVSGDLFVDGALLYAGMKPTRATLNASADECLADIAALQLLEKIEEGVATRGISSDSHLSMDQLMADMVGALQACNMQIADLQIQLDALK